MLVSIHALGKKGTQSKMVMEHTIRRSPMLSSESVQGGIENGLFNSTDSGGKEAIESEAQNFNSAIHEISKMS